MLISVFRCSYQFQAPPRVLIIERLRFQTHTKTAAAHGACKSAISFIFLLNWLNFKTIDSALFLCGIYVPSLRKKRVQSGQVSLETSTSSDCLHFLRTFTEMSSLSYQPHHLLFKVNPYNYCGEFS